MTTHSLYNLSYHLARRYLPPPVKRWFLMSSFVRERVQPKPPLQVERAEAYLRALRARLPDQGAGLLNGRRAAGGDTTKASIVMLTKNRLALTQLCLESILRYTGDSDLEIIVVDNASTDGTQAYVGQLARRWPAIQLICNERNEGFARATNQGIQKARGDYIVLLNNDTIVTRGWLGRLLRYLEQDPKVGMVGPVTNDAANEQMIAVGYTTKQRRSRSGFSCSCFSLCSPELNPDERAWNDLKSSAIGQQVITAPDQLHSAVIRHLRFIQNTPARDRAYLNNATTQVCCAMSGLL